MLNSSYTISFTEISQIVSTRWLSPLLEADSSDYYYSGKLSGNGACRQGFGQSSLTPIKELSITECRQPSLFSVREVKVKLLCAVNVCD